MGTLQAAGDGNQRALVGLQVKPKVAGHGTSFSGHEKWPELLNVCFYITSREQASSFVRSPMFYFD